jgi:hypothetical protein
LRLSLRLPLSLWERNLLALADIAEIVDPRREAHTASRHCGLFE